MSGCQELYKLMGYNDEGIDGCILFDIETVPLNEAAMYLEPVEAPSNYKDPLKIEEYVRGKEREQLERAALDLDLCRIVAIGSLLPDQDEPEVQLAIDEQDEAEMLRQFFLLADAQHFVGFNILDFDLPILLRRALYLGVQAPYIALDRYRHPRVLDLLQVLSYNGKLKYRSQAFYCKRFRLDVEDYCYDGKDVPQLVARGQIAELKHHVTCDVRQLSALAKRLGYWPHRYSRARAVQSTSLPRETF